MELSFKGKISDLVKSSNIANDMSDEDLRSIGLECKQLFEQDKATRSDWEQAHAEAMKLALQVSEKKTFPWPECSNVKFPLITIAAINFHARAFPALIDGNGVVNYRVVGEDKDGQKELRAKRVTNHQNYLLLEKTSWEEDADKSLLVVPIMGCAFKKTFPNFGKGCPESVLVFPQDLVVPYYTSDLKTCPRISQIFSLNRNAFKSRVRRGQFLDWPYEQNYQDQPVSDPLRAAKEEAQKIHSSGMEDEWVPTEFIEQHTWLDLDGDGFAEPYIVTFVRSTGQLCRIVARYTTQDIERNKKDQIVDITPQHYFTKIPFIPSPDGGFYDIGFGMLLGNLNAAVDTAINQMFDAGTMEILGGGFIGRGVKIKRGETTFAPYEWKTADSPGVALKDNIVPLPVRGPSQVLLELLLYLVGYAERISSANEVQMGEVPGNQAKAGPMEIANNNGLKIFAAIYKRIWRGHKEEFKKYYDATSLLVSEGIANLENDLFEATADDYALPSDGIIPSADPNVSSPELAVKQALTVWEMARTTGGQNIYKATMRVYKALKVPRPEEIYPDPDGAEAIPPIPDAKLMDAETKRMLAEVKAMELKKGHLLAVADLMRKVEESQALIIKLQAEAAKLQAEARGVAVGHNIALIQSKIAAQKQRSEEMFHIIELLQAGLKETANGTGKETGSRKGKSESGSPPISGVAEPAGNTEVLSLSS